MPRAAAQVQDSPGREPHGLEVLDEADFLALLREPISLKEIAGRLFISYLTVRRHTANIYGKLGVNKRQAAVARAKAMGLIPRR